MHPRRSSALAVAAVLVLASAPPAQASASPASARGSTDTTMAPTGHAPRAVASRPAPRAAPTTSTPTTLSPPPLSDVDGQFLTDVRAEVGSARQAYDAAVANQVAADTSASDDAVAVQLAADRVSQLRGDQQQLAIRVETAHDRLRDFAVAAYVTGGASTPIASLLGSGSIGDFSRRRGMFTAVVRQSRDELTTYNADRQRANRETLRSVDLFHAAQARQAVSARRAVIAADAVQRAAAIVASRQLLLTVTTDALPVGGTDIPRLMLDAYQRTALTVQARGCRLAWWGLAAVGRIESDHGRLQNGALEANGDIVPPILGPALDGSGGTAATPAVDGGKRTGDPHWDHAVGPMQFIASTWKRWGADGNADGLADPDNAYDAALTTAHYLCAASSDLDTPHGLRTAYFSYNHSDDYVTQAVAYAASYEAIDAAGAVPPLAPVPLYAQAPASTPG